MNALVERLMTDTAFAAHSVTYARTCVPTVTIAMSFGKDPTGMVSTTVRVAVSITEIEFDSEFVTYANRPSGEKAMRRQRPDRHRGHNRQCCGVDHRHVIRIFLHHVGPRVVRADHDVASVENDPERNRGHCRIGDRVEHQHRTARIRDYRNLPSRVRATSPAMSGDWCKGIVRMTVRVEVSMTERVSGN